MSSLRKSKRDVGAFLNDRIGTARELGGRVVATDDESAALEASIKKWAAHVREGLAAHYTDGEKRVREFDNDVTRPRSLPFGARRSRGKELDRQLTNLASWIRTLESFRERLELQDEPE